VNLLQWIYYSITRNLQWISYTIAGKAACLAGIVRKPHENDGAMAPALMRASPGVLPAIRGGVAEWQAGLSRARRSRFDGLLLRPDGHYAAHQIGGGVTVVNSQLGVSAPQVPPNRLTADEEPLGNMTIVVARCNVSQDFGFATRKAGIVNDRNHLSKRVADQLAAGPDLTGGNVRQRIESGFGRSFFVEETCSPYPQQFLTFTLWERRDQYHYSQRTHERQSDAQNVRFYVLNFVLVDHQDRRLEMFGRLEGKSQVGTETYIKPRITQRVTQNYRNRAAKDDGAFQVRLAIELSCRCDHPRYSSLKHPRGSARSAHGRIGYGLQEGSVGIKF
jgi:hypothetical protein